MKKTVFILFGLLLMSLPVSKIEAQRKRVIELAPPRNYQQFAPKSSPSL